MLRYRVAEEDADGIAVELRLEGTYVFAYKLRWIDVSKIWVAVRTPFAKAQWDFKTQSISVAETAFGRPLADVCDRVFGEQMRAKDRPRQGGIFEPSCSVCGRDRDTFPETMVKTSDGEVWVSSDEPLHWRCHVCDRLVCRHCTLVRDDLGQYYFHTYCSEACRSAAPESFANDDEVMSS